MNVHYLEIMMNEKIKEKLLNLREVFKILLISIVALMTGLATIIYNVFTKKIPFYSIMLAELNLFVLLVVVIGALKIYNKMDSLIEEME